MRRLIFGLGLLLILLGALLSSIPVNASGNVGKATSIPTPTKVPTTPKIKLSAGTKTVKVNVDLGDICWGNVVRVSSTETFYNSMVRFTSARKGVELTNAYCVSDAWRWIVQQWLRLTTGRIWIMKPY